MCVCGGGGGGGEGREGGALRLGKVLITLRVRSIDPIPE